MYTQAVGNLFKRVAMLPVRAAYSQVSLPLAGYIRKNFR
jgi:hypothetical protein